MRVCDICKKSLVGKSYVRNYSEKYNSEGAGSACKSREICLECEQKIDKYIADITKKEAKYE